MSNASNPAMCVRHTTLPLSFHYKRRATTCCLFGSEFGTKKTQLDESSARLHIWNSLALGPGLRRSTGEAASLLLQRSIICSKTESESRLWGLQHFAPRHPSLFAGDCCALSKMSFTVFLLQDLN